MMKFFIRIVPLFLFTLFVVEASAHAINYALEEPPATDAVLFYLKLGFEHIIPDGLDHILFISALCLASFGWKHLLWQATAFTIAHSITLALSMQQIVSLDEALVEPVIALSIAFVAIENILVKNRNPWRLLIVFLFGLIHGLGFASSLAEIGLPRNRFFTSILSFNVGVEVGQIAVIVCVYLLFVRPFSNKALYKKLVLYPVSIFIGGIALYWTFERLG